MPYGFRPTAAHSAGGPFVFLRLRIISTTTRATPPALHRKHAALEQRWARTQRRLLGLSSGARQILVPNSGHYIQFDRPKVVIDAILSELPKSRK
jgi:pimeloyl-ACP methyl ester carboxylesterase